MSKVLMLYASMTGSTEMMADAIHDYINENGHEVVKKCFDFDQIDAEELLEYKGILFGSYTWDDALPYEVEDFYDEMDEMDLKGRFIGFFGSCDSFYDTYGAALDILSESVTKLGAEAYDEKLKVELEPDDDDIKKCQEFAQGFLNELSKQ